MKSLPDKFSKFLLNQSGCGKSFCNTERLFCSCLVVQIYELILIPHGSLLSLVACKVVAYAMSVKNDVNRWLDTGGNDFIDERGVLQ